MFAVLTVLAAEADTDSLPPGYSIKTARSNPDVSSISQMAFRPGDFTHVYAVRSSGSSSMVFRYDYDPVSGLLSNPFAVIGNPDNKQMVGVAFHGADMYVSFDYAGSRSSRPGDGRISRFMDPDDDGFHQVRHDIVFGINKGDHDVEQIQFKGDSLYVSIGAVGRKGDPAEENIYSSSIAFIEDITQISTVAGEIGSNFKGPINYLADPTEWIDPDGPANKLRYFASGFRNPFGIAFDPEGDLWVTVNGNSDDGFLSDDFIYKKVSYGDMGEFPPQYPGQTEPFTRHINGNPITNLVNLGLSPSPGGLDFILEGPDAGKALVGQLGATRDNSIGRDLLLVDPDTGTWNQIYQFAPEPAPTDRDAYAISDVVRDPYGRFLISDFGHSRVMLLQTPLPTPRLKGTTADGMVRLSWPLTGVDWKLEHSPDLPADFWEEVTAPVQIGDNEISVELPQSGSWHFFRLKKI